MNQLQSLTAARGAEVNRLDPTTGRYVPGPFMPNANDGTVFLGVTILEASEAEDLIAMTSDPHLGAEAINAYEECFNGNLYDANIRRATAADVEVRTVRFTRLPEGDGTWQAERTTADDPHSVQVTWLSGWSFDPDPVFDGKPL
ncbi:hypothetical protein [Streptomyces sp. 4R-3d]|uniref:hypothetical protein n=1 Tax=Streptomyces sp. 4R-3d TaxID=2559605 RepID=UPI001072D263|nr:hypothetical protein [Streptomyces sp. 4R-3d]TFI30113.1 hypothetical protein E4P36_05015 [Streptomyces sp. 4R-3d]